MSICTLILGESGTGKSTSLRNLNPDDCLLIQAIKKPLPFRSSGWSYRNKDTNPNGNIFLTDKHAHIEYALKNSDKKIIIIDDFQYVMSNEFMRRVTDQVKGNEAFQKYNEIAKNAWDILMLASHLDDDKRVYILSHTDTNDMGRTKIKTIGKLLDEKITIEGMVTIVMRSQVINGNFLFSTKNSGADTVKTPMGMFEDEFIDNNLKSIDDVICDYYQLTKQGA